MPAKGRNSGTGAFAFVRGCDCRMTESIQSAYEAYREGSRLLDSASAHAAVVALERARALEPDKGSIRETLGRAYFHTGRFVAAGAEFARAVELDPVNDYALFGLGLCR